MSGSSSIIPIGSDGFYHPAGEADIQGLIAYARVNGLQIRVRGSAHSVAWSVYTDPGQGDPAIPNQVTYEDAPRGPNLNLMLDRMTGLEWIDKANGLVEAEAGIHLGEDPLDPLQDSPKEKSLLFQAFKEGWGLSDLGGITHQTVSGFTATGSAGGSLTYDLAENILAYRIIDGQGNAEWIDKDNEIFGAVALSLGLLGIITKVRLQLVPTYDIKGTQVITPVSGPECPIDLTGPGTTTQPSLERFLRETEYTRLLWWPQHGAERLVTWQAKRDGATRNGGSSLTPYREFADSWSGDLEQLGGAIFFTVLGNAGVFRIFKKLGPMYARFRTKLFRRWRPKCGGLLAWIGAGLLTLLAIVVTFLPVLFFGLFKGLLLKLYPRILGIFQGMTKKGQATRFRDYYWRSLPMDNSADDVLLGTGFTELFIPLSYTEKAMKLLSDWYADNGWSATGFYSTELYAGYKSNRWMSPAYENDKYAEGTVRIDFFWYKNNQGMPNERDGYFAQFWSLFKDNDVPFRLHWGKYIPDYDHGEWAKYYESQLPMWKKFLELREARDEKDVFLTDYWRLHLYGPS